MGRKQSRASNTGKPLKKLNMVMASSHKEKGGGYFRQIGQCE